MLKAFPFKIPLESGGFVYVALYRDLNGNEDEDAIKEELAIKLAEKNRLRRSAIIPVDEEEWKRVNR